jgi:AbrB family looped-hinge helix DNA binding protein
MKITIDGTGRVVLPKSLRDRFHLVAGTELDVNAEADGISLRVVHQETSLVEKAGILVHHGAREVSLDVAEFINREREARALQLGQPTTPR